MVARARPRRCARWVSTLRACASARRWRARRSRKRRISSRGRAIPVTGQGLCRWAQARAAGHLARAGRGRGDTTGKKHPREARRNAPVEAEPVVRSEPRQPGAKVGDPHLIPPNSPQEILTQEPVLFGCRLEFPLVACDLGRQLGEFFLNGLALVPWAGHEKHRSAWVKGVSGAYLRVTVSRLPLGRQWWQEDCKVRTIIGGTVALLLLTGCGMNMGNPLTANATEAQRCERGGGWWRANLGVCDWQGAGKP